MNVIHYDSVKSTNCIARTMLDQYVEYALPTPDVVVSRKQTQGRGRSGTWFSPEDCGIYMSVITNGAPLQVEIVTQLIGIRIGVILRQYFQLRIYEKGINDIYLANRKLAGILCEYHAASDKLIVGVGLNTFRPATVKIPKHLLDKSVWLNEFSAESLIDHRLLVNMIAEEIIQI